MYYKMTKEQYKKYRKQFTKESYIGRSTRLSAILLSIIAAVVIAFILSDTMFIKLNVIETFDIVYYAIMILFSILIFGISFIQTKTFEKMLKEYIEMESKKK